MFTQSHCLKLRTLPTRRGFYLQIITTFLIFSQLIKSFYIYL